MAIHNQDYHHIQLVLKYLSDQCSDGADIEVVATDAGLSVNELEQLCERWCDVDAEYFIKCALALDDRLAEQIERPHPDKSGYMMPGERSRQKKSSGSFRVAEPSDANRFEIKFGFIPSPYGECLLGLIDEGICHLAYTLQDDGVAIGILRTAWSGFSIDQDQELVRGYSEKIFSAENGKSPDFCLPPKASNFQIRVSNLLLDLPSGSVSSYGGLAASLGTPRGARAVGNAVANNTIAQLVPCHRVLGSDGAVGAYRWGQERKRAILLREQILLNENW